MKIALGILAVLFFVGCGQVDGAALFKEKCANCHGTKGMTPAFGKSRVIATWSSQEIQNAIKGYKSGTYGRSMKGLMRSQVRSLNDTEIQAIADYIVKVNN